MHPIYLFEITSLYHVPINWVIMITLSGTLCYVLHRYEWFPILSCSTKADMHDSADVTVLYCNVYYTGAAGFLSWFTSRC